MKISEVSKKYGISEDTLRYYEKIGLIPRVHRNKSGVREYTEEDCRWIEFIKCMREAGVQIEALVRYVKLFQQGDKTIEERKKILMEQREQLISRLKDIQKALDKLNLKIEAYETIIVPAEKKLKGEEKVSL
ncbi:MAG: MerR family transcriptional regulator [Dictyoglomus sp.]|nr:MerR family transcriptional regulator [Dictyoglomus sp.]MCX7942242.1 MerR family transcriptional regulator [Dictyoglomaceae bacterium]MDW8189190.1 MerR family transcriptional regulator [Dictyoglomus sp.]